MIETLRALERKYRNLALLRERREIGRALAEEELDERRLAFRRLAAEFPGALRELDETPRVVLEAKARAVAEEAAAVAAGRNVGRLWVRVVLDFHEILARVLAVKMALARGEPVEGDVEAVRRPPRGRLLILVWAELEARHGLARDELERLVFGAQE